MAISIILFLDLPFLGEKPGLPELNELKRTVSRNLARLASKARADMRIRERPGENRARIGETAASIWPHKSSNVAVIFPSFRKAPLFILGIDPKPREIDSGLPIKRMSPSVIKSPDDHFELHQGSNVIRSIFILPEEVGRIHTKLLAGILKGPDRPKIKL
jgi:hypothetical protein